MRFESESRQCAVSYAWDGFSFMSGHELTGWKCGIILSSLFACFYPCMRVHGEGPWMSKRGVCACILECLNVGLCLHEESVLAVSVCLCMKSLHGKWIVVCMVNEFAWWLRFVFTYGELLSLHGELWGGGKYLARVCVKRNFLISFVFPFFVYV